MHPASVRSEWMYRAATVAQGVACRILSNAIDTSECVRAEILHAIDPPLTDVELYVLEGFIARAEREFEIARKRLTPTDTGSTVARRAAAILRERYAERWTLERLARELATNRYDLTRGFKAEFGIGVHRYLVNRRLQAAEDRIRAGEKVEAAALDVGFRSRKTFYDARRRLHPRSSC